jgi:hypothetical protein
MRELQQRELEVISGGTEGPPVGPPSWPTPTPGPQLPEVQLPPAPEPVWPNSEYEVVT